MIPQKSGKIINICSLFSFLGGRGSSAYAATKHGLAGFTKAYCDELAMHNIQVNGIAPGYYATEITRKTRSDPGDQPARARPYPGRALGRARRPDGRARLPGEPRVELRQRPPARRRRRLPGALSARCRTGTLCRRRGRRLAEHQGGHLRPRRQCRRRGTPGAAAVEPAAPRHRRAPGRRPVGLARRARRARRLRASRATRATSSASASARSAAARRSCVRTVRWREPVISWMDTRAYQPYVPDDPARRLRDDLVRLPHASPHRRIPGHRGEQHRAAVADRHRPWQWSEDAEPAAAIQPAPRATVRARPARRRWPAGSRRRPPRQPASRPELPVVVTANDKAVEALGAGSLDERTALVSLGTYIAAMVHGDAQPAGRAALLDQLRLHPAPLPVREPRHPPRHVDADLVPGPAGPRVRGGRGGARRLARAVPRTGSAAVPAGSDGLVTVLDWLAPTDKPFRKGVMLGFDARHTRAHGYRSILEAIALTMKASRRRDEPASSASRCDEIVVSAAAPRARSCMQVFADVFGIPASRARGPGGASLGSADLRRGRRGRAPGHRGCRGAHGKAPRDVSLPTPQRRRLPPGWTSSLSRLRDSTDPVLERTWPIFH